MKLSDSLGKPGKLLPLMLALVAGSASAQSPLFQTNDLLGTQTDGFRVRLVNSGSAVGTIDIGETVLAGGSLPGNGRGLYGTVNFGGTAGSFAGTVPFPAGASGDNFALEATGLVNIASPGTYVFGVDGDDGFRLRMGSPLGTISEFVGPTGNSNTRVAVTFAKAGLQPLRLAFFENGGGEFVEFYARPGTDMSAPTTPGAFLVGDTGSGGLQSIATGQFFVRDVKSPGLVNNLGDADNLLRGTVVPSIETTGFRSFVDMWDPPGGGGTGNYANNQNLPGHTGVARDDLAVESTGMIYISEAGTYTFGINGDDGGRVQINGARVINDDTLHGATTFLGQHNFAEAGFYDLRHVFFERGGGATTELFMAKGALGAFDANAFRLVGDVANGGVAVFSPKGWKGDFNGDYTNAANWRDGQVAGGTDAFASFSNVDLTADRTVTVNAAQTLGNLRFGDVDATGGANNWTVAGAGSLNLDVAAGKPVVEVLNNRTTVNLPVTGNDGLAKTGAGTLVLGNTAAFTGDVDIQNGTLEMGTSNALPNNTNLRLGTGTASGKLQMNGNSQTVATLATNGTGTDNRVVGGSGTTSQLTINSTGANANVFNGVIGGPGANENNIALTKTGAGTVQLTKQNTYTGDTVITGGTIQLGLATPVAGASLWLDADDSSRVIQSGGFVDTWADRSGNNRNATGVATARPVSNTNGLVSGRGVMTFDGVNDMMGVDLSFLAGTSYTIFAVEGRTSTGNDYLLGTTPGATNQGLHVGYRNNTTWALAQFANDLDATVPGFTSQQFNTTTSMMSTTTGKTIFRNGAQVGANGTQTTPMTTATGGRVGNGFNAEWFQGDISEILIYNSALSAADRQAVEAYLAQKWSSPKIASNILPAATNLQIGAGGTLDLNGTNQTVASFSGVSGSGGVLLNSAGPNVAFTTGGANTDTSFNGTIQDGPGRAISFVKEGTGTQTLAGPGIAYRGNTTVNGGKLVLQDATKFGSNAPAAINLANNSEIEFQLGSGLTSRIGATGQPTISGTGNVTKSGAGNLILSGTSTYSGETVVSGGLLRLDAAPAVTGASLWLDASDSLTISTTGANVTGWADKSGNNRNATQGTVGNAPTQLANSIAGNRNVLRFDGADDLMNVDLSFLQGSEYTIFAVEGRRNTGNHYYLGTAGAFSTNNSLHVGYRNNTAYTLAQYANDIDMGVAGYASQEFTIWSNILDFSSGHAIYRNGTLGASNGNTTPLASAVNGRVGTGFTGGQFFNGDIGEILIFNRDLNATERQNVENYLNAKWRGIGSLGDNILPTNTALKINSGATVDLNGFSQTVASLSDHTGGGGILTNNGALGSVSQFTVSGTANTTFSGVIQDGSTGGIVALTKTGSGQLTLAGASTYTGATNVTGGELRVNGSLANTSSVSVSGSGVLSGTGTITSPTTTFGSGSTLSPGNSPGVITLNTNLTLGSGSTLLADVWNPTSDRINLNGTLAINDATIATLWGGGESNVYKGGTATAQQLVWLVVNDDLGDLITGSGFLNDGGAVEANLTGLFGAGTSPYFLENAGGTYALFYDADFATQSFSGGNDLLLVAIPEPSRALLFILMLAGFAIRRRRNA